MVIDGGTAIRAVNLNTAPGRAVIALQRDLGMKLEEIVAKAAEPTEQAWAAKVQEFLSEHNRGQFVTFDQVLDRPLANMLLDADEQRRVDEDGDDGQVPTPAGTGTPAEPAPDVPDAPEPAAAKAKTRRSSGSAATSRGSKGRSAPAS
jgi:predicted transcriptional regulator